ncbi:MAG: peptide deformylase [Akkermansiaceae bacterium]|nr:peptide deformylase [Akkermansiaceae bacterium]
MILPITQYGDPILRKKCPVIADPGSVPEQLVTDMLETMHDAHGVGLAGPQVGVDLRLAVVDVSHDPECVSYLRIDGEDADLADLMPLAFINPDFEGDGERESLEEGCLSIHDIRAQVRRPGAIRGTLGLLDGRRIAIETDGLLARVIQHETDHLNGVLFIDRLSTAAKVSLRGKLKRLRAGAS